MDRLDRFDLEGVTYYQQGRKCGKPSCRCAQGMLHGPYWYCRDQMSGKVGYIGKELLPEVAAARAAHEAMLPLMVQERRRLLSQADALARLIGNQPLSDGDRAAVAALGFGAVLVRAAAPPGAQDD